MITLSANAVDLQAIANATSSHSVAKSQSFTVGAALAGPLGDKITAIGDAIERAQNTDNDRLQGALVLKAGYDAYKLSQGQTPPTTVPAGTETSPGAGSASSGIGASVTIGSSKSKSESSTHDTQVTGTNLQAKNIDIEATETDLHMAAAKLQAENIALTAQRDILLEAAANTSEIHSSNKSSNASVGVTFAVGGQQNGFSIQISAAQARGKANGTETSWDNSLITASDTLTVRSGRDTTLQGAQLAGNAVNLDVGRDLWVETLQDVSNYASKQSSSGFSLSLCIPPICGGTMVTGSISASNQKIKHAYQSAVGQSGIAAGDGGFDITGGNHTDLVGAAITSTAEADQNRFSTASLASRDLTNTQETQASSSSAGFSYGSGSALTTVVGNTTSNLLANLGNNAALPENGSESGTTQSVISPAAITITGTGNKETDAASQTTADELTSRDPKTANGSLTNTLTLQQAQVLEQKIQEQKENQEAANLVGAVLSNVVGDIAISQRKELQAQEDARAKAAGETPRTVTAWGEGSVEKIALHGLVGLIEARIGDGSAAAGALGAISQEVMAPILSDYLVGQGYAIGSDEYKSLMQLGATLVGTAVGTLATGDVKGASTGANSAFVGVTNNFLDPKHILALVEAMEREKENPKELDQVIRGYQKLDISQSRALGYLLSTSDSVMAPAEAEQVKADLISLQQSSICTGQCQEIVSGSLADLNFQLTSYYTSHRYDEEVQPIIDMGGVLLPLAGTATAKTLGWLSSLGADVATAAKAGAAGATDSRGLSNLGGIFSSMTNKAGGRVWTSTGTISQNDFAVIVNSELMQGKNVNIISGVHGGIDGSLVIDRSMFLDDVNQFSHIPGVKVYNYSDLSPQQLKALLQGSDTTIGGFCNSGTCLK